MKAEEFAEQLDLLMERAVTGPEMPAPRMIYELTMAQQRIIRLQLLREQQAEAQQMMKQILPANCIKLPPHKG